MIHPKTELKLISEKVGYGVIAKEFIPAGTITWVLDELDKEYTPEEVSKMSPLAQEKVDVYCYRNRKGNMVMCWDYGKYVNHSFNSNCLSTAYDFEIAIRDIQPGEELTDDYGYLNISSPFEGVDEGTERKIVYPDDLLNFHEEWDKKLKASFHKIPDLDQPLKALLSDKKWEEINKIAKGQKEMKSIKNLHFHES